MGEAAEGGQRGCKEGGRRADRGGHMAGLWRVSGEESSGPQSEGLWGCCECPGGFRNPGQVWSSCCR